MLRTPSLLIGLLTSTAVLAASHEGRACGGVFSRDTTVPGQDPERITVAAQRMALAVSNEQTVLWSQVEYAGDPSEFAWVIPVGPGAFLEESTDAWLEALDAFTSRQIVAPTVVCHDFSGSSGHSGGCGCGSAGDGAPGAGAPRDFNNGEPSGVSVLHEGSVGPYQTVTLDTSSGQALQQWLVDNGYAVPPEVVPTLDTYAAEGLDFIALRLTAGAGIDQMTPVRVVAPGGSPIVPLRMMTAGADATVPISLFIIAEGRLAPENFPSATLDLSGLTWDFGAEQSNYTDLRATALAANNGRGFLTSAALRSAFLNVVTRPDGSPVEFEVSDFGGVYSATTLPELYLAQASTNTGMAVEICSVDDNVYAFQDEVVVPACADGSTAPGGCPDGVGVTASSFECAGFTDLAVALLGMRPADVWITRLEADLPRDALVTDLQLAPPASQVEEPVWIEARDVANVPCASYDIEHGTLSAAGPTRAPQRSAGAALFFAAIAGSLTRRGSRPRAAARRGRD